MDKKRTSEPWDMNDMDSIMRELDAMPTPPSVEQLRQRYDKLKTELLQKEETGGVKRDREEGEDVVPKVPKLNMGVSDPRYLKDIEYWKRYLPPTWEELKQRQDGLVSCDTPASFEQQKRYYEECQAKLLQKEEK